MRSICLESEVRFLYQHGSPIMCLAVEEAVARCGMTTVRVWTTSKCVVVGRFQDIEKEVDVEFCLENGIVILRRFTGGGAVFLDEGVACLSFCLPLAPNPLDIFHDLSLSVAQMVGAEIDEKNSLFIGGKKVSGAASCKKWGSLFHHMTVLVQCNLDFMKGLTPHENQGSKTASTFCEVTNVERNMKVFLYDLAKNLQEKFKVTFKQGKLSERELGLADRLMREKYTKKEWNFDAFDPF